MSNSVALIFGMLAEHNLPFSMDPVFIEVSRTLDED